METRSIGALSVPVLGVGCNQFGTITCDEATSIGIVHEALDAGLTYFDIADEYGQNYADRSDPQGWGRAEEILGRALRGRRDEVVIATKVGSRPNYDDSLGGNSAAWIREAIDDALRRLQTDHVDLYQIHFPDPTVPIAETLGALDEIVRAGKALETGCSNFTKEMLREADDVARDGALHPFASLQSPLNLFQRGALYELLPTCHELGMSFIPYWPLASGMLTGKYRRDRELPGNTRLTDDFMIKEPQRRMLFSEKTFARLEALEAFATDRGRTLLELAFAWLLAQPCVATVIAGAARPGQATANAAAGGWRLTPEEASQATRVVQEAA